MNFKTYLMESIKETNIYEFYALEYILNRGNTSVFEEWQINEIQDEMKQLGWKIWNFVLSGFIKRILEEIVHGELYDPLVQYSDDYEFRRNCRAVLRQVKNKNSLSALRNSSKSEAHMSLENLLKKCDYAFRNWEWESEYGDLFWSEITDQARNMLTMENGGELTSQMIDTTINQFHNTKAIWTDISKGRQIKNSLDVKSKSKTPLDFIEKIKDKKIRKWLRMVT